MYRIKINEKSFFRMLENEQAYFIKSSNFYRVNLLDFQNSIIFERKIQKYRNLKIF
jgi:hypothetical protein